MKPFPYGVMREPLSALKRADIIVITRSKFAKDLQQLQNKLKKYNPSAKDQTHAVLTGLRFAPGDGYHDWPGELIGHLGSR